MKLEDKLLLLKDLCGRLPYGVKCKINRVGFENYPSTVLKAVYDSGTCYFEYGIAGKSGVLDNNEVIPYLRPMSSMTEEEEIEYDATFATIKIDGHYDSTMTYKSFDFLNAHHFDYRGLIENGLALEAPEGMYNIKEE